MVYPTHGHEQNKVESKSGPLALADGHLLYFHKMVNGTFVIHHLQR